MKATRRYNRHRLKFYAHMNRDNSADARFLRAVRTRERREQLIRFMFAPPAERSR